jgi:DNA-directed RNA polymerase I and III subunit RPAC1
LICVKGIGKTHAKWSPVSTAYYRLLPSIEIKSDVYNDAAVAIKNICPTGVFDIEDLGEYKKLVVKNPRNCTTCRECIRSPELQEVIELAKINDHYECIYELIKSTLNRLEYIGLTICLTEH